jgi:hypothetical protein
MIKFACPNCRKAFQVAEHLGGQKGKCSECGETILVPPPLTEPATAVEASGLTLTARVLLVVLGIVVVLVATFLVWEIGFRDKWEYKNSIQLASRLDEADRIRESDPFAAYKTYDEILIESGSHKLTDQRFIERLSKAKQARDELGPLVEARLKAEEDERQRRLRALAAEEAENKRRTEEEAKKQLELAERERRAKEEKLAEEVQRKKAATAYLDPPSAARDALNALKKVEARTEIGVNYRDYSTVVGETWGDVKIFIESPDGRKLSEFSRALAIATDDYKLALEIWGYKLRYDSLYKDRSDVDVLQQQCWARAGRWIKIAEGLLNGEDTETKLAAFETLAKDVDDLRAQWKGINDDILNR